MAPLPRSKTCCNARYSPEASWACFQSATSSTVLRTLFVYCRCEMQICNITRGWNPKNIKIKIKSTAKETNLPWETSHCHFRFDLDQRTIYRLHSTVGEQHICHSHRHLTDRITRLSSIICRCTEVNDEKWPWKSKDLDPIAFEFPPSSSFIASAQIHIGWD
jgi:hypothetical protein